MVANFDQKRKKEFQSVKLILQFLAVLLILAVGALAFVDFKIYKKRKQLEVQVDYYHEQIQRLEKGNKDLRLQIENADNVEYLERVAYEQLGEQKPGEQAVIFVAPDQELPELEEKSSPWTNWFSDIWGWIKSKF